MNIYKVGELFSEGKTKYQEGCIFEITDSGSYLNIFFDKPNESEIKNISKAPTQIKILFKSNILFLFIKFEGEQWIDSPYTVHLSKDFTRIQDMEDNQGLALHINLIDSSSGILKAMRLIAIDNKRSNLIKTYIEIQKEEKFDEVKHTKDLNNIYNNYSTKELLKFTE
jgi:hypothetical protein